MKNLDKFFYGLSYFFSLLLIILGFVFLYAPKLGDHGKYKTFNKLSKVIGDTKTKKHWRQAGLSMIILGFPILLITIILNIKHEVDYSDYFKIKHDYIWIILWILFSLSVGMVILGFLFLYLPSLGDHGKYPIGKLETSKGDTKGKRRYRRGGISLIVFGIFFIIIFGILLIYKHHKLKAKNYVLSSIGGNNFNNLQNILKGNGNNEVLKNKNVRNEIQNYVNNIVNKSLKGIPNSTFLTDNSEGYKKLINNNKGSVIQEKQNLNEYLGNINN